MASRLFCATWALLCLALAGCGTLPDAKPFADASQALAGSVSAAGQAVADSLVETGALSESDDAAYKARVDKFRAAWAEREAAARAMAAYAGSVSDLVSAGREGAETVKKVGDSLSGLAGALGIPVAAPALGVAGDVARFLADRIAMVVASDRLETALSRAQPAVDRLAERIATEADQPLRTALQAAYKNQRSLISARYDNEQNQIQPFDEARSRLASQALSNAALLPALLQHDQVLAALRLRLAERDRLLGAAAVAYRARLQLLNALAAATATWAQAHRDLAQAVQQKRKTNVAELQATITDLKALAKKVSEL